MLWLQRLDGIFLVAVVAHDEFSKIFTLQMIVLLLNKDDFQMTRQIVCTIAEKSGSKSRARIGDEFVQFWM